MNQGNRISSSLLSAAATPSRALSLGALAGVLSHEISEVLGRLGLNGGTIGSSANSYDLVDLSYTGPGGRSLAGGPGASFSIDNGNTLAKLYNDYTANGLDSRDWAPGNNDAFNQFSNSGVVNPVTPVDLQEMDVIGYDRLPVPEPGAAALLAGGLGLMALRRRTTHA